MNVLILGSGGREHALTLKLSESKKINKLFVAPGNAGTNKIAINVLPSELNGEVITKALPFFFSLVIL